MSEANVAAGAVEIAVKVESPPAAQQPVRAAADQRGRLLELARELVRSRNRMVLAEYLRLRRIVR